MKTKFNFLLRIGLIAGLLMGSFQLTRAQGTVIAFNSFDSGDWPMAADPAAYNTGSDIWDSVTSLSSINPSDGMMMWGMQDLDNPNGGGDFWHTLSFAGVDISTYSNVVLTFDYYTIGYDGSDSIGYIVEYDNGTTWGPVTELDKNTGTWTTVTVNVPADVTTIRLRLQARQNGGSDYAAFDNIVLSGSAGPTVIAFQSFEAAKTIDWAYTPDPAAYNTGGDVWDSVASLSSITPSDGLLMWGMRDLNNPGGGGDFWHTLTFVPVDVSAFSNVTLSFDYYTIGYDGSDSIGYIVEFDDGTTWGPVTELDKNTEAWTTVTVNVPGGTQWVRLRLQARQNGGSDYAAFDNVILQNSDAGDVTPPEIVNGGFLNATNFFVVFSEPVTQASAENTANYSITPGQTVTSATLTASMDTVYATVSPGLEMGIEYTASITGVVDTSSNANEMVPFTTSFYFNDYNGSDLKISELSYSQPAGGIQDIDYMEIYNAGASDIDLAGMYFTQGVNFEINQNAVVPAGGYLVICENLTNFNQAFPSVTNVVQWESGGLSSGGEDIEIRNSLNEVVIYMDYGTSTPWPEGLDSVAIELCDLATDYTVASNWRHAANISSTVSATLYGSPGADNSCVAPPPVTDVATIAELRTGATDGTLYRLTGEAILTYQQSFRNQKFIQDATAAILIDDNPGTITTTYNLYDGITNITGTLTEYGGMMEFIPSQDPGAATSTGNTITPEEITLADLKNNFEDYEAELIKLMNVKFVDAGSTFSNGTAYITYQGTDTMDYRTTFYNVDYIGTTIPDSANIVAIPNSRNDGDYYTARDAGDIEVLLPPTASVTFRVDMSQTGLDLSQGVNLMGINNNWDPGFAMADDDNDMIYELTMLLESGDYEYKFKTGLGVWEEMWNGGNRTLTVVAGQDTILPPYCFGSTQPCSGEPTNVTFKVDMNMAGLDLSQGVELMGSYNGWASGTAMDDSDGDLVYEVTVQWAPNTYEYKFRTGAGVWEDGISNRIIEVGADDIVLDAVCFDSYDPCPYPAITITSPEDGEVVTSADVTVEFTVENWVVGNPGDAGVEGHIHWMLDGDSQPMKYDVDPIELMGLADGDHTVIMKLVDNDHVEIGVADTVMFNVNTTVTGGGMETFTNSNATSSYSDGSYVGDNGITWNYIQSRDDNGDANGSGIDIPALMLRRVSDNSAVFSEAIPGGIGNFSVKLYKGFTGGGDRQVELLINDVSYGFSEPFDDFEEHIFTVENINVPGDIIIRLNNVTPKQIIVDDITWTGYAGAAEPGLLITSPPDGYVSQTDHVTVEFSVANFMVGNPGDAGVDGHIHWTLDGGADQMKFDTDPIEITGLTNGDHTVILKLFDNSDNELDPPVADTVNFTVDIPEVVEVSTIADLRNGNMDGTVYELTGEAVITYAQSFRNQKFIQDATAAILIDDPDGVITTTYVRGDGMMHLKGTLTEYNGLMEFIPFEDPGDPSSTGNEIVPEVVTLDELNNNFDNYESELILVETVAFVDAGGEFQTGTNYDILQDGTAGIFRTAFFSADYIGGVIPALANITCLAIEYNGTAQIVARDMFDFEIIFGINEAGIAEFTFYPNPNNGRFTLVNNGNSGSYRVELIDMTGKTVYGENMTLSQNEKFEIDAGDINPGIYLIKLIDKSGNNYRTSRLIVK